MSRPRTQHPYKHYTINHRRGPYIEPTDEQKEIGAKRRRHEALREQREIEKALAEEWDT